MKGLCKRFIACIVAVIIAAISAYYLDSGSKNEFKVKKIKKI